MLLPILVSLLAASCAASSQNAQKQAAPAPDAVNRQQSTVIARTGAAGTPGQVQVKMIRDGKEIDLTGDDVIEVQGMELDDLDVDAIVNDADIQARIAEAMANVRAVMPQVNGAIAGMGMSGANWAAVEGMLLGLADAVDALVACGVEPRRILLIGGAAASPAVQHVATTLFTVPVHVPTPGEYVADGAARQAAWVLSAAAEPPAWSDAGAVVRDPAPVPAVREAYAAAREAAHPAA